MPIQIQQVFLGNKSFVAECELAGFLEFFDRQGAQ